MKNPEAAAPPPPTVAQRASVSIRRAGSNQVVQSVLLILLGFGLGRL